MSLATVTGDTLNHAEPRGADPYARLGAAVLDAAYRDLAKGNKKARQFFECRLFAMWADAAGIDHELVMDGYRNVIENGLPVVDERQVRYSGRGR